MISGSIIVALSAGDVSNIYAELSAGIHYQAQALNNPTGFSATGLPAGLSIDPTTGAITGHTTAVGDHNITLTASNLSGASPSKTITITVAAQKPLLTTVEFSPKNTQGVSLWLDASDANTISTGVSTNVSTWTNKIDPDVKMHGATAQPDTGGSINGLNAINFVGVANSYHEGMYARKNTSTAWSPAGTNGAPSGTYDDLIIAFVLKLNGNGFTSNFDTFNLGFGKHFFGANNQGIWWQYPTNNVANLYLNLGTSSNVLIFKHSVTENIRQVWLNGTSAGSTSASISAPTISGEFRFPCYDKSGGDYYNLTLGEMIVIKGTLTNNALQEIEGYLGSKWNLTDSLPNNHPYKSSSPIQPKIVTSAVGSNSATATATLLETGGADTIFEVFYGTADKGETVIGWDSNSSLPDAQNPGNIELGMSGLTASTSYVYRIRASNSAGSTWSDNVSFTTGATPNTPALSVSTPTVVGTSTATAKGNLLSFDGTTNPNVTLYYGPSDGNQTAENWSSNANLSTKPVGSLNHNLTSLTAGTTYFYRYFATVTISGTAYSSFSDLGSFTTLGLPQIETPGATEITKTSATLNAKLTFTNGNDSNVTFYWGDNNGSNNGNHNQWDNPLASSTNQGVGVVGQSISGLSTGTTYYYTAKAVNAQGTAWATVKTFVPANTAINKYSIPDLALWLDATDLDGNDAADSVANGSALPSWTDKSVTPKTVNQTSSTEQPVVISNAIGRQIRSPF